MAIIEQAVNKRMHDINNRHKKILMKISCCKQSGYGMFSHDSFIKSVNVGWLAQNICKVNMFTKPVFTVQHIE